MDLAKVWGCRGTCKVVFIAKPHQDLDGLVPPVRNPVRQWSSNDRLPPGETENEGTSSDFPAFRYCHEESSTVDQSAGFRPSTREEPRLQRLLGGPTPRQGGDGTGA